jgi:anti-anti-sigma regulatory factor
MNANGNNNGDGRERRLRLALREVEERKEVSTPESHVVFDFTGLHRPDVADLALILTARLQTPANENVWVRAIDPRTGMILRALGLDHLFRHYPKADEMH